MNVCSYHVMYAFQGKSTFHSCLKVKELLPGNRHDIWSLSDSNGIETHNHLVHKWTLNHLAKQAKWLSYFVSTYLYSAFDCMLLSCHARVSVWICNLWLPRCQETPCSKQARYLKFKWQQRDSNISSKKYYDNCNTWNLIKATIIVIFSITTDQVFSITATWLAVSSQNRYKTPYKTLGT